MAVSVAGATDKTSHAMEIGVARAAFHLPFLITRSHIATMSSLGP